MRAFLVAAVLGAMIGASSASHSATVARGSVHVRSRKGNTAPSSPGSPASEEKTGSGPTTTTATTAAADSIVSPLADVRGTVSSIALELHERFTDVAAGPGGEGGADDPESKKDWRADVVARLADATNRLRAAMESLKAPCRSLVPGGAGSCPGYSSLKRDQKEVADAYFNKPERRFFYDGAVCCDYGECSGQALSCLDYETTISCDVRREGAWEPGAFPCRHKLYPDDCCAGLAESEAARADKAIPPGAGKDPILKYVHSRNFWGTVDLGRGRNASQARECTPYLLTAPRFDTLEAVRGYTRAASGSIARAALAEAGATVGKTRPLLNMDRFRIVEAEVRSGCVVEDYTRCEAIFREARRSMISHLRTAATRISGGLASPRPVSDASFVLTEEIDEDGYSEHNDIVFARKRPTAPFPMRKHELVDGRTTCTASLGAEARNLIVPVDTYESEVAVAPRVVITDGGVHEAIVGFDVDAGILALNDSYYLVGVEQLDEKRNVLGTDTMFRIDDPRDCDVLFELTTPGATALRPVDWKNGPEGKLLKDEGEDSIALVPEGYATLSSAEEAEARVAQGMLLKTQKEQAEAEAEAEAGEKKVHETEVERAAEEERAVEEAQAADLLRTKHEDQRVVIGAGEAGQGSGAGGQAGDGGEEEEEEEEEEEDGEDDGDTWEVLGGEGDARADGVAGDVQSFVSKDDLTSTAEGLLSPSAYAKRLVGTPYRGVHGTMVRLMAAPSPPGLSRALRDTLAKFGRRAEGPTILDASVAGPAATYAFGRMSKTVWETKDSMVRKFEVYSSPLARLTFMLRTCNAARGPTVLSNSWGIDSGVRHDDALEDLKSSLTSREVGVDLYAEAALRNIAVNGRGGLGCLNFFAAPNDGARQVMSSDNRLLYSPYIAVGVGFKTRPDGSRWCYVGDSGIRGSATVEGRGVLPLPSYGANVAVSAPVGYCTIDYDTPQGSGARLTEANGNSAATPLIAAAAARVSSILPTMPWNAVLDLLVSTAETSRFVLPTVYDGRGAAVSSAVMLPRREMGCACRTRAIDWWACDVRTKVCPRASRTHSIFNGYGAVDVPAAVAAAKRLSSLMRADPRLARSVRQFYLRRTEHKRAMRRSRDPRDVAACRASIPNLSPAGHDGSVAFVASFDEAVLAEHVNIAGATMRVDAVGGVSMWLERVDPTSRRAILGSASPLQSPDLLKRKKSKGRGVVFDRAMSMRYWGELAAGSWRLCISGLSAADLARADEPWRGNGRAMSSEQRAEAEKEISTALKSGGEDEAGREASTRAKVGAATRGDGVDLPVYLSIHGQPFHGFTLDPRDAEQGDHCTCAPPKADAVEDWDSPDITPTSAARNGVGATLQQQEGPDVVATSGGGGALR